MPRTDQPAEDAFEVEITDLTPPERSRGALFASAGRWFLGWQRLERRRARRWLSGASLVALVCILLAALLNPSVGITTLLAEHWPFSTQASLPPNSAFAGQSVFRSSQAILCPVQASWSPDSAFVAVLGYTQPCDQSGYVPAQVDFYRAATVQRVAHWQLDEAILAAVQHSPTVSPHTRAELDRKPIFGASRGGGTAPAIQYLQMLWSPDAASVAISFGIVTRAATYEGLFLARRDGSHTQVLLHPEPAQAEPQHFTPLIWDLQSSRAASLPQLPPSLTYIWEPQGHLLPGSLLPAHPDPSASYAAIPTGNPDGGPSFSIWQPGHPAVISFAHMPGAYLWYTNFAAWSPDKRYVITNFVFSGLMEPPGRTFPSFSAIRGAVLPLATVPHMPAHDPALISGSSGARTVAWNPAGSLLAVASLDGAVDLYDCRTGRLLRSLKPVFAHPFSVSVALLSWSPDGRSLLLSSAQWGLITVWGPQSLGHL